MLVWLIPKGFTTQEAGQPHFSFFSHTYDRGCYQEIPGPISPISTLSSLLFLVALRVLKAVIWSPSFLRLAHLATLPWHTCGIGYEHRSMPSNDTFLHNTIVCYSASYDVISVCALNFPHTDCLVVWFIQTEQRWYRNHFLSLADFPPWNSYQILSVLSSKCKSFYGLSEGWIEGRRR